jgi:cytochrome b6
MAKLLGVGRRFYQWMNERYPLSEFIGYLSKKTVPRHKHSIWYYFGGLTLFFFGVQVVTGILLSLYYKPSPDHAYESVKTIINDVSYGWLVRSMHSWSANLMIASLFVHMFSAFLMKAYRKPRELMWVSGVLLMFLVLGFAFTGYLLPWDTVAYFATLVGTEVPKSLPVVGNWGVWLLKGGEEIGAETLSRMYSIHVIILPLTALLIVAFHILMNQTLGSSVPVGSSVKDPPIPFFPNFLYRDLIVWTIGLVVLLSIAVVLPWGLGEKADPLASAPEGIKPEWYFLPLYQTLKFVPARLFSLSGELIVNSFVGVASAAWFLVPFIDQGKQTRLFTIVGLFLIAYLAGTIIIAYVST